MAKKRSQFSLKEDRQLIQMAATSVTLEEAAAIFRTSANTIENKCKRLGIQLRRRGRKRSTQEWTEADFEPDVVHMELLRREVMNEVRELIDTELDAVCGGGFFDISIGNIVVEPQIATQVGVACPGTR